MIQTDDNLPESPQKLYPYVLERNIPFQSLTIKNIRIDFSTPDNNSRLYGSLKMVKDSAILISLRTSLGIEISRIFYTRDSVIMLDRKNRNAYFTNYENLGEIAPLDFRFQMLQTIFTGNLPGNYNITPMPEPECTRDSLQDELYLGTFKAPEDKDVMNFYGWIFRDLARPSYLVFHKEESEIKYIVKYVEYQEAVSDNFPREITVIFDQYNQTHKLNLKLNDISSGDYQNIQIDVPSSYKTICR
ncbi:MAG: DUF4292 domain-containing protein [Bacteroidota bacterium]